MEENETDLMRSKSLEEDMAKDIVRRLGMNRRILLAV